MAEDKNRNGTNSELDNDYYPANNAEDDVTDDDLDIAQLLDKYLKGYDGSENPDNNLNTGYVEKDVFDETDSDIELIHDDLSDEDESSERDYNYDYKDTDADNMTSDDGYMEHMSDESEIYDVEVIENIDDVEAAEFIDESDSFGETGGREDSHEIQEADEEAYQDQMYENAAAQAEENTSGEELSFVAEDVGTDNSEGDVSEYQYTGVAESEEELFAEETPEFDESDYTLMLALGLDDEIKETMGPDVADKIAEEIERQQAERNERLKKSVDSEYIDKSQTASIMANYKKRKRRLGFKLFFAIVLTLILGIYESLHLFGMQFDGALDPVKYPVVYIMGSLQLLLLVAAFAYEQLLDGFFKMFKGKLSPKSAGAITLIISIIYSAVSANIARVPIAPRVFNFPAAVIIVFILVYSYLNIKREMLSFNVISAKRPKYIINRSALDESSDEMAAFKDMLEVDEADIGDRFRIEKTQFVNGYFARTSKSSHVNKSFIFVSIIISLICAAAIGVYSYFEKAPLASVVNVTYVAAIASFPLSLFLTLSYPFFRANKEAYDNDGTIIGECSLEEYSNGMIIAFDDSTVFPSFGVKAQNIKIYNNHRIDRVLYYASSMFSKTGGPLGDVFEVATMEMGHSDDVVIKAAEDGFLYAVIDGKNIVAGSSKKLISKGFNIPASVVEEDSAAGSTPVMYMFREGRLMAKMFINYAIDSDFEMILRGLSDDGMCVAVKTFDPNINDKMLLRHMRKKDYPLKVVRYSNQSDVKRTTEDADSGIVARGSAKSILKVISYCTKVLSVRRTGIVVGVMSAIISVLVLGLICMSGNIGLLSSVFVVLYQLLWTLPLLLTSRMFIR